MTAMVSPSGGVSFPRIFRELHAAVDSPAPCCDRRHSGFFARHAVSQKTGLLYTHCMTVRYCPICKGVGFVRRTEYVACPDCGGIGRIASRNCPACDGRGTQPVELHRVCETCKGTGLRFPEQPPA
jgi:hypothetical protein